MLGSEAIACLAHNLSSVHPAFQANDFQKTALNGLDDLEMMDRAKHIARALRPYLPEKYEQAVEILLSSLTPPNTETEGLGLAVFFYQPHGYFVSKYGLDSRYNDGDDPFEISMKAQYELTKRNTSEFSIRPFLIQERERTLKKLSEWTDDPDPHVRRLCSEGTRPRLPWAPKIPAFVKDPFPILSILEALKNDENLYVRRSVANNLGDIAKDHPEIVFEICESWLDGATNDVKWLIRHALRHPAKKGIAAALRLREAAK